MTEISSWQDVDDDDDERYPLLVSDPLGVLTSTREVVELGELVWINTDQIEALSEEWLQEENEASAVNTPLWYDQYHFQDGTERTVNWLLVLDAVNFCFWAEKDQPRWSIEYKGETLNGYWAEAASLTRAVEEQVPLWDAKFLSTISSKEVAHIFRGNETIPLLDERVQNMREVGRVLLERFDGQFARAIEQVNRNAPELVLLLADNFSSFRDISTYRNQEVRFFKRAQICVADLYGSFGGKKWGAFTHLEQLTAFADYKLPQVLRHYHVLEYDPTLAEHIDHKELLEAGSEEEIEIRAATVWACELLRRTLLQQGRVLTASEIDQRIWLMGQRIEDMRPYHRTRTMYY